MEQINSDHWNYQLQLYEKNIDKYLFDYAKLKNDIIKRHIVKQFWNKVYIIKLLNNSEIHKQFPEQYNRIKDKILTLLKEVS